MVEVVGIRNAKKLLEYYGSRGTVTASLDRAEEDCYYCSCRKFGQDVEVEEILNL